VGEVTQRVSALPSGRRSSEAARCEAAGRSCAPSLASSLPLPGRLLVGSEALHFPVHGRPSFPLLELHQPQSAADPLVRLADDARRVRQPEVGLPAGEVAAQCRGSSRSDQRVRQITDRHGGPWVPRVV
jgi:hypothetical protein